MKLTIMGLSDLVSHMYDIIWHKNQEQETLFVRIFQKYPF